MYLTILALPCGDALTYWPTLPAANTDELAVNVTLPDTADGVSVPAGLEKAAVKAYFGIESKVIAVAVQVASVPPRTILIGLISGCTTIKVSAD